jgi:hypothetical protein
MKFFGYSHLAHFVLPLTRKPTLRAKQKEPNLAHALLNAVKVIGVVSLILPFCQSSKFPSKLTCAPKPDIYL